MRGPGGRGNLEEKVERGKTNAVGRSDLIPRGWEGIKSKGFWSIRQEALVIFFPYPGSSCEELRTDEGGRADDSQVRGLGGRTARPVLFSPRTEPVVRPRVEAGTLANRVSRWLCRLAVPSWTRVVGVGCVLTPIAHGGVENPEGLSSDYWPDLFRFGFSRDLIA